MILMETSMNRVFIDPRTKYPKPEFSSKPQPIPGSEKEMSPQADHGENSYQGNNRLNGAVAIITGGDSGIGRAIAVAYAHEGAHVAFTYLEEDKDAQETERLIKECGVEALSIKMDQTVRRACEAVIDQCVSRFGRLDILINNAAFQKVYDSIEEIPDEDIDYTFRTNLDSFLFFPRCTLKLIPPVRSIIHPTSIQPFAPIANLDPYATTKAAIANFTLSLAEDATRKGVSVNAVAPVPVWPPLIPS